jgi:transcriptional repressor NrdR
VHCPFCRAADSRVVDSRLGKEGAVIRRRRHCDACTRRFTTYEQVDELLPMVVKKDDRREPFDRAKVISGLKRACSKRPISMDTIAQIVDRIERQLEERGEKEVRSSEIGALVMRELHALDPVAYVRFASVYREFKDVDEFLRELEELIATRRTETPRRTPARARRAR